MIAWNGCVNIPQSRCFHSARRCWRAVELSLQNLDLKPFDQAILAAVLVRAHELRDSGADAITFCELDGDLQPWDKDGRPKEPLHTLYADSGVLVYGDFALETPTKIASSPQR